MVSVPLLYSLSWLVVLGTHPMMCTNRVSVLVVISYYCTCTMSCTCVYRDSVTVYMSLVLCASLPCRIDIHFVIKIADFGLSEDVYAKNYFRQTGSDKSTKLPVKWMAPESLTDGIFSEKSDVVGFGMNVPLCSSDVH